MTAGLAKPPESPWRDAYQGWVLGSGAFVDRVRAMVRGQSLTGRQGRRESRLQAGLTLEQVRAVVCSVYEIPPDELSQRRSRQPARAALAYVAHQRTTATHAELMRWLGVSRPESVQNLARRDAAWLRSDVRVREQFRRIEQELDRLGLRKRLLTRSPPGLPSTKSDCPRQCPDVSARHPACRSPMAILRLVPLGFTLARRRSAMTPPIDWPRGAAGTWLSGNLDQYRRDPRARNGRVARQSLVKRGARGIARLKDARQKRIRPHLPMQLRVPLGRRNNRKFEESL